MPAPRLTPFELVFGDASSTTFPAIRAALKQAAQDPRNRDAFFMLREVVTLVRELRPDEGLGPGIDQLAALIHQAYLFWDTGAHTIPISREGLANLLKSADPGVGDRAEHQAYYVQLPLRRVWAQVISEEPAEPLDGCFVSPTPDLAVLRVLGVFGIHPERPGFSVVEVSGRRPVSLARLDGSPIFTPILPGGAAAGLYSLMGEEELLELGWRTLQLAPAEASAWRA